jgi:DNA-binding CsgD family transcriptional regulator/tetratricopeptide (TPR) repeat protein
MLADVAAGASRVVELVGEPGMGKTSLLDALRTRGEQRGFVALTGQATEFERLPFAVFVDALDDHLCTVERARLAELGDDWIELLSAVFPALAGGRAVRPELSAAERHVLYRAVRAMLARLHDGSGVVLLLDDLHWADEATAELLDHLLRHPPGTPLLLALAYRPRQLSDRIVAAFAGPSTQDWWRRIDVSPLSRVAADELCGDTMPISKRRDLYAASGGNPFYLEALMRSGPPWRPDPFGGGDGLTRDLPQVVRAALLAELSGLSASARLVAQGAAVLGEVFEAGQVPVVAGTSDVDTLAALDVLCTRDLVRQADSPQRFRFRHPLLRSVIYGAAGQGWRLGAHARAAGLLAVRGASLPAQAVHVERSASTGDDVAIDVLVRAAAQVTPLAPGRAAHWLREALRLLGDRAGTRPQLWMRLAHTLGVAGQLQESRDILREALGLFPAGPSDQRLQAVTSLAMVQRLLGQHADAKTLLRAELDAYGGVEHTGLELEMAAGALRGGDFPAAVSWGERALASATANDETQRATTAAALLALAHVFAGSVGDATARLDEAVHVVDREPDRTLATHLDAILRTGWTEVFLERYDAALRHLGRGLDIARQTGQSYVLADMLVGITYAYLWSGQLPEAAAHAEDALEAALLVGSDELRTMAAAAGVAITMWSGDMLSALRTAEKVVSEVGTATGRGPTIATGMLAQARLHNGDAERARQTLLEAGGGDDLPLFEFPTRTPWFRVLVGADLMRGETAGAEVWVRRAEAIADVTGLSGQRGHALLARSALLVAGGDAAGAASNAQQAANAFAAAGMRLYQAQAHMAAGAALVTSGDRPGAMSAFGQAKALFTLCGADSLRRAADVAQRGLGGRSSPRSAHGNASTQALSDREQQIAELVSQGHTNRQIAEQLFMSPRTVEAHMSRIFAKLGVSSRSAVASAVAAGSAR